MKIKIFYNKEQLKEKKLGRTKFYFTEKSPGITRGYNKIIRVFGMFHGLPFCIGFAEAQTASWVGGHGCAAQIVGESFGYKHDTYNILRKDVSIYELC